MKNKPWYKRKEFWGPIIAAGSAALGYLPDAAPMIIQKLVPAHTLVFQLAQPIGILLGGLFTAMGLKKGYKADNLPSGITKAMDKIPDSLTGVKGASNESATAGNKN